MALKHRGSKAKSSDENWKKSNGFAVLAHHPDNHLKAHTTTDTVPKNAVVSTSRTNDWDEEASVPTAEISKLDDPELCQRCRGVGSQMLNVQFSSNRTEFGSFICSVSHIEHSSPCKLCKFLWQMRWSKSKNQNYHLHAFSARRLLHDGATLTSFQKYWYTDIADAPFYGVVADRRDRIKTTDVLKLSRKVGLVASCNPGPDVSAIRGSKWVYRYSQGSWRYQYLDNDPPPCRSFYGREVSQMFDYSLVRKWLEDCPKSCSRQPGKNKSSVPIYLIDCHSRKIILAPKKLPRFVALSYVLGNSSSGPTAVMLTELPGKCHAVVEDAITVTKSLEYSYLWVDQYCIDSDAATRQSQITRMDQVYKHAALTLVAASGQNAGDELPGVSSPRMAQPKLELGGLIFVSTLSDPIETMKTSKYNTRGWTYQEYFLSNHRLVFTNTHVSFICPNHRQFESLSIPMLGEDKLSMADLSDKYLKLSQDHKASQISYRLDGTSYQDDVAHRSKPPTLVSWEHHIQQYTGRDLTHDSDSLNAIRSILERFRHEQQPIDHLWGLPIPTKLDDRAYSFRVEGEDEPRYGHFNFAYALCWTHGTSSKAASLRRRRKDFPSWSWIGWSGRVTWLVNNTLRDIYQPDREIHSLFRYPDEHNQLQPLSKWRSHSSKVSPVLLTSVARAVLLKFEYIDPAAIQGGIKAPQLGYYLRLKDGEDSKFCQLHLTQILNHCSNPFAILEESPLFDTSRLTKEPWPAINLGYRSDIQTVYLLVIGSLSIKDKHSERIGILQVPMGWWKQQHFTEIQFQLQ